MTEPKMSPAQLREHTISVIHGAYLAHVFGYATFDTTRSDVIIALNRSIGRKTSWNGAVTLVTKMIDAQTDDRTLDWAILQYGIIMMGWAL